MADGPLTQSFTQEESACSAGVTLWKDGRIRAFGNKLGKVIEIDQRNQNRGDCFTLRFLLEMGITEHLPPKVTLNCGGKVYQITLAMSVAPLGAKTDQTSSSQSKPDSEQFSSPPVTS